MSKLLAHFKRMQDAAANYLEPSPAYTDRKGRRSDSSTVQPSWDERHVRDNLFAGDMIYMLDSPEQRAAEVDGPESGFERVRRFHEAFSLPINQPGYVPTPEERLLRGKLMLEEVMEHLLTGLGLRLAYHAPNGSTFVIANADNLEMVYRGDDYNAVETLDGLVDVKVIANGTGVAFGLPVEAADRMVFESNMSKLDAEGKPIINGVTPGYKDPVNTHLCADSQGYRPDLPIGKVLKPATFVAPDIASLLSEPLFHQPV